MENISLNIEDILDPISQNLQDKDILDKVEEGNSSILPSKTKKKIFIRRFRKLY